MRSFKIGKRWVKVGTWACKFDHNRKACGCCEPKNILHPSAINNPMLREYFFPRETGKTKTPRRR